MENVRKIPEEIEQIGRAWRGLFHRWWFLHYFIGITGATTAITVASNPKFLQAVPYALDVFAWVAAVCVSLLTFLEPKRRARAYVAAWRLLHEEIGKYRYGDTDSVRPLFTTVRKGEEIIAQLDA